MVSKPIKAWAERDRQTKLKEMWKNKNKNTHKAVWMAFVEAVV